MKHHTKYMAAAVVLLLTAALPIQAQDENAAFYIYQNDGHFEGFFYDEVQKISYSKIDTLGVEHEDFVSQEIITADSTYRIMLSTIDSVGFVQPEIVYNPNVVDMEKKVNIGASTRGDNDGVCLLDYYLGSGGDDNYWRFSIDMPDALIPQVGQVLLCKNLDWDVNCRRVTSVEKSLHWYNVYSEPIDSITDLFQQFITVEEYSHDRQGNLLSRRVAGMPELTRLDNSSQARRSSGNWSGDIFDFSISGHVPMPWGIELVPNIEGKLNIKTNWNLSLGETKYIGITATFNAGVSLGFSIDYKFADILKGQVGASTAIPMPAACPLFEVVLAPDCFIKAEAKIAAAFQTSKVRGKVWAKLEFIDWIPYLDFGMGTPPGGEEEEKEEEKANQSKAEFSFVGTFHTGVLFPLELKTNKILSKIFDCSIGSFLYVGPEISANVSMDFKNVVFGDNTFYNNFKDSKISITPIKATFETKGKKSGWFDDEEFTFVDGSMDIIPSISLPLLPSFSDWEINEKDSTASVKTGLSWALPVKVGIYYNGRTHCYDNTPWDFKNPCPYPYGFQLTDKYYHFMGDWFSGKYTMNLGKDGFLRGGKYKLYPAFYMWEKSLIASPAINDSVEVKYFNRLENDPITFAGEGEKKLLCEYTGPVDKFMPHVDCLHLIYSHIERYDEFKNDRLYNQPPCDTSWVEKIERQYSLELPENKGIETRSGVFRIGMYPLNEEGVPVEDDMWDVFHTNIIQPPSYKIDGISLSISGDDSKSETFREVKAIPKGVGGISMKKEKEMKFDLDFDFSSSDDSGHTVSGKIELFYFDEDNNKVVYAFYDLPTIKAGNSFYWEWVPNSKAEGKYSSIRVNLICPYDNLYHKSGK